jgi:hypothetical protein
MNTAEHGTGRNAAWGYVPVNPSAQGLRLLLGLLILTCAQLVPAVLRAQTTGEVRIHTVPEQGVQYVLDGKYRMTERLVTLPEGTHRFVFWAPEHAVLDTSIFVMGNWTTPLKIQLQRPPEYVAYRQELERTEKRHRMGRLLPPLVVGAMAGFTTVSVLRYAKAHNELKDLKLRYTELADPGGIERLKTVEIPEARDRFRSARNQTFISSGLLVASIGATAYIRHRIARAAPPVYEDRERVRFEGLVWVPGAQGGVWSTAITFPLR